MSENPTVSAARNSAALVSVQAPEDLRAQLVAALKAGGGFAQPLLEDLYADPIEVWHNYATITPADGLKSREFVIERDRREWEEFKKAVPDFEFLEPSVIAATGGIVVTARISGSAPGGARFDLPVCVIYRRDKPGRIVRRETWASGLPELAAVIGTKPPSEG
jgi:hypothetical protein